jgi:predicted transcriptional regulator
MANKQWFLVALRDELHITQAELAKSSTGLTQLKISAFERGDANPTPEERKAIVDFLVRRAAVRGLEILILDRK